MFIRLVRPRITALLQQEQTASAVHLVHPVHPHPHPHPHPRHSQRRRCNSSTTTQTFHTKNGKVKIDLSKPQLVGCYQSRGERPYQEDRYAVQAIQLDSGEVERAIRASGHKSVEDDQQGSSASPSSSSADQTAEQALYVGVFDGHNGHSVSDFLRDNLHSRVCNYSRSQVSETVSQYRALGGYLRRYRAGILQDLVEQPAPAAATRSRAKAVQSNRVRPDKQQQPTQPSASGKTARIIADKPWNLHQRLHASFLEVDLEIIENEKE